MDHLLAVEDCFGEECKFRIRKIHLRINRLEKFL